jgi:hypothetical protein
MNRFNPISSAQASQLNDSLTARPVPTQGGLPPGTPTPWGPAGQVTRADLPYMQGGPLAANLAGIGAPTPLTNPGARPAGPLAALPAGFDVGGPNWRAPPRGTPVNPNTPTSAAQPVSATTPAVNPATTGGAGSQASSPYDRFVQVDRPNAPAGGGQWAGGGPQKMTALNLAGLFNRGQPGQAVNPNAPSAAAQPVSAVTPRQYPGDNWDISPQGDVSPSFGGGPPMTSNAPLGMGPLQKNAPAWLQQLFGYPGIARSRLGPIEAARG